MIRSFFLPRIAWAFYALLSSTWRKKLDINPQVQMVLDKGQPIILAHWHGDELAVLHLVKRFKLATMTSTSKDGQIIDFVIHKLGGETSRGSSTRGAVGALKGLVRLVRSGHIASIAVDGPRGPIYEVKPGVFELSRLTQAIIVPVGVFSSKSHVFHKSWNKALLPLPFQKVIMTFDQPLPPLEKGQLTKDPKLAEKLRDMLFEASKKAAKPIAANELR